MQSLLSNTCYLFYGLFEVFNEMETEIKVINYNIHNFRNFIIYHFLVESKPHERIDLLITASMNIYQTKKEKKVFQ